MRMLDYVAAVEALDAELGDAEHKRRMYGECCLYLADQIEHRAAGVALRLYVERKSIRAIAEEMHYSQATIKRIRQQADQQLARIEILSWDGEHVPLCAARR